jgi:predicted HTH transcriptional regulator
VDSSTEHRIITLLNKSLGALPQEINELDWKSGLSTKTDRLAAHLSAFSHLPGGGFMIFGVNNDTTLFNVTKEEADVIVQKLTNIAQNSLSSVTTIDHIAIEYRGYWLLAIHIKESQIKPVHLRSGDIYNCYKRSGGATIKMSAGEVKNIIATSYSVSFEEQISIPNVKTEQVIQLLDVETYFRLINKPHPSSLTGVLDALVKEELLTRGNNSDYNITNLGCILLSRNMKEIKKLNRKAIRVIVYKDGSRLHAIHEQIEKRGYASNFEGLIDYIMSITPTNEIIQSALRSEIKMYPEVAIREFVANALIHQDYCQEGNSVMIEIFPERMEITNPGSPLVDTDRFIDTPPKSRNETLASLMRRLSICEERGSGVDRAIAAIEAWQLPAPKFLREDEFTKVIMFAPQILSRMAKEDRIRACYQHCALMYVSGQITNNQSVRKRFNITERNYPIASRILSETVEAGYIKPANPENQSRKHITYIPFWA